MQLLSLLRYRNISHLALAFGLLSCANVRAQNNRLSLARCWAALQSVGDFLIPGGKEVRELVAKTATWKGQGSNYDPHTQTYSVDPRKLWGDYQKRINPTQKDTSGGNYDPKDGYNTIETKYTINGEPKPFDRYTPFRSTPDGSIEIRPELIPPGENELTLMFVVTPKKEMLLGRRTDGFPHPALIGGIDPRVRASGEIVFEKDPGDGKVRIKRINNASGHYLPFPESLDTVVAPILNELPRTVFSNDVEFEYVKYGPDGEPSFSHHRHSLGTQRQSAQPALR